MRAFYFATEKRILRYDDNRPITVGITHSVEGGIECCSKGLHASEQLFDAVKYAPGPILYLVELAGDMDKQKDKVAARSRKYIAEFDATELLESFARKVALSNTKLIKPYCSKENYTLIVRFLETGNKDIRKAAKVASEAASRVAYMSSLKAEAWDELAAEAAAKAAAWASDRRTAMAAAKAAAWASWAVWAASMSEESVAAEVAAAEAASWAAWVASMEQFNVLLTDMVREATGWDI